MQVELSLTRNSILNGNSKAGLNGSCHAGGIASDCLDDAVAVLNRGGVVAFPTETSYGLAARIDMPDALEKIFSIKGRPASKPLLVLIPDQSMLCELVSSIPDQARVLIKHFWPGPLTILFGSRPDIHPTLTCGTKKIGVRISSHPMAEALCRAVGIPITATSANTTGSPAAMTAQDVESQLASRGLDFILDGGECRASDPSTILDVTLVPPRIVRFGAVPSQDISSILNINGFKVCRRE